MFFANPIVSQINIQPSSVWSVNRNELPVLFNRLHDWWKNNLTQSSSFKTQKRVAMALITGKLPIYLKGTVEDSNGVQNAIFIIHGGGELSEKKLWMIPVSTLTSSCQLVGGPGTPASTVELFRY
jgi:hypothetical protein